jgi:hypothetical protein
MLAMPLFITPLFTNLASLLTSLLTSYHLDLRADDDDIIISGVFVP